MKRLVIAFLYVLPVLACLPTLYSRVRWENDRRTVGVAVNWTDIKSFVPSAKRPEALQKMKVDGLNSLVVPSDAYGQPDGEGSDIAHETGLSLVASLPPDSLDTVRLTASKVVAVMPSTQAGLLRAPDPFRVAEIGKRLEQSGIIDLSVDYDPVQGDRNIAIETHGGAVKVHAPSLSEVAALSNAEVVARYRRACLERNVRWVVVRPNNANQSAEGIDHEVKSTAEALRSLGPWSLELGIPSRSGIWQERIPHLDFIEAVWVCAVLSEVLLFLGEQKRGLTHALCFVLLIFVTAAFAMDLVNPLVILAPVAVVVFGWKRTWSLAQYLALSAVLLAVAGLTVASQDGGQVLLGLVQVRAIKFITVAPFIAVALWMAYDIWIGWKASGTMPKLDWRYFVAGSAFLALLALLLIRSGNDPLIAPSNWELNARGWMEAVFIARPRTKEVLVGYPALVLAHWLRQRYGLTPAVAGVFLLGMVGPTSTINSFLHFHTPLSLTLLRVALGFGLGCILGLVCVWVVQRLLPRHQAVSS